MHAVEDHGAQRHRELRHLAAEVLRLGQHLLLGRRHEHEGRLLRAQQLVDRRARAASKPSNSPLIDVKNSEISTSAETPVASSRRRSRMPAVRFTKRIVAQPAEKYGLTNQRITCRSRKSAMPLRRLEEVERMAGRRRVDDDQVVAAAGVQLGELLDRHVLLRAGEALRQVLIEAVGEDALAHLRGRRVALDQLVPGALLVEHHGARACRRRRASTVHAPRLPSARTPSASASRRAGSMVITIVRRPCCGAVHRQRRGGRRLAHPAAAGADDHAVARHDLGESTSCPSRACAAGKRRRVNGAGDARAARRAELLGRTERQLDPRHVDLARPGARR